MDTETQKKLVLYFEDDPDIAEVTIATLVGQGFDVCHFDAFPENGLSAVRDRIATQPDLVILDVQLPGLDGYEICEQLRTGYLSPDVPIMFTSGLMAEEDILKAYAVGADDYLIKPVRLKELLLKVEQLLKHYESHKQASEQFDSAMKMAFDAMQTSSELGDILRFVEATHRVTDNAALADLIFSALAGFGVQGSAYIELDEQRYFRDDGRHVSLELQSMQEARDKGRIFSWKHFTFFNYQHFSVLIRNMPIDDEERYGVLKDQFCLLLNGVDARIDAILLERNNQHKQQVAREVAGAIAELVLEMEQDKSALSGQFETTILNLENNLSTELIQFSLLEEEERSLMSHVALAIKDATAIFEESLRKEAEYKAVMQQLLSKLESENENPC
ncbi:response regulator [Bowmanella sp. Y26]|uniref:response regulator transcription factor n=1 Tax=Bowmanella yangjiangensis TaxID=2811230 RepID=UPI001BDD6273|nr:response regulator [Bowmanella yangjiangensis]MBT1065309.1 response regulator [Bowmanella yangjiangensis]